MNVRELKDKKGSYSLIVKVVRKINIKVGAIGNINLVRGIYVYNGSAFGSGGIRARIAHHLRKNKAIHWHIDYLTSNKSCKVMKVIACYGKKIETEVSLEMLRSSFFVCIQNFGATDDKSIKSHLFRARSLSEKKVEKIVKKIYQKIGCKEVFTYLPSLPYS